MQLVDVNRRDIAQYRSLGNRYSVRERPREAERAYTSIVEALPLESESHELLATIREEQNRWPEALEQWEQSVRIRALEPTGLLGLAGAQIHEKQFDAARESVRKLQSTSWPPRFADVSQKIRELEERLKAARDR
jgi:tetratricopeptide (TPR) repeat protein